VGRLLVHLIIRVADEYLALFCSQLSKKATTNLIYVEEGLVLFRGQISNESTSKSTYLEVAREGIVLFNG
jgi:hypothetical protein